MWVRAIKQKPRRTEGLTGQVRRRQAVAPGRDGIIREGPNNFRVSHGGHAREPVTPPASKGLPNGRPSETGAVCPVADRPPSDGNIRIGHSNPAPPP